MGDDAYGVVYTQNPLISCPNLVLQREFSYLGFLLFRFSNLRVRLR